MKFYDKLPVLSSTVSSIILYSIIVLSLTEWARPSCVFVISLSDSSPRGTNNLPCVFFFSREDVLVWLHDSMLPRLLDESALLRDTGSVLLGTLRLRQIRDAQGEISLWPLSLPLLRCELVWSYIRALWQSTSQTYWIYLLKYISLLLCVAFFSSTTESETCLIFQDPDY